MPRFASVRIRAKHTLREQDTFTGDTVIIVVRWLNWKLRARACRMTLGYLSSKDSSSDAKVGRRRQYAISSAQLSLIRSTFTFYNRLLLPITILGATETKKSSSTGCWRSIRRTLRREHGAPAWKRTGKPTPVLYIRWLMKSARKTPVRSKRWLICGLTARS